MEPEREAAASGGGDPAGLADLIARCLERLEEGGPDELEVLLREHPEQADQLRERLARLQDFGLLDGVAMAPAPPTERLGNFRLIEQIGRGGMGVVYRAEQEPLGREVALKLVRPDLLYFEGARERFQREVQAVARLQHPGIVPVYTVGEDSGVPYYAMERIEGQSLEEVVTELSSREPRDLDGESLHRAVHGTGTTEPDTIRYASWAESCVRITLKVAEALDHAHRRGVLHRDVKPSNVMLTGSGRVVLLDFGLASTRGAASLTRTGSQIGSLPYMAPEQIQGRRVDERTDVYALGVVLYELLTLHNPYLGATSEVTMQRVLAAAPPLIQSLNAAVPWDVDTICRTAMDRDPRRRYPSAAALARDLGHFLAHRPIEARRPGALLRARRFVQRRPAVSVAMVMGVVLLIGSIWFGVDRHLSGVELAFANTTKDRALGDLGEARTRLEALVDELTATNDRLQDALGTAEDQTLRAEQNLGRALDAGNRMLKNMGFKRLRHMPGMEDERRQLLEEAARFFGELELENPRDPDVRMALAESQRLSASVLNELGRFREGEEAVVTGISILRELYEERADIQTAIELAHAFAELGEVHGKLGDPEAAQADYQEAIRILNRELEGMAGHGAVRVRMDIALRMKDLAGGWIDAGRLDEATELLWQARDTVADVVEESQFKDDRMLLVAIDMQLGRCHAMIDDVETARDSFRTARTELEDLIEEAPRDAIYRANLAGVCVNLLMLAEQQGNPEQAEPDIEQGIALYQELVRDYPRTLQYRLNLSTALRSLGTLRRRQTDLEAADDAFQQSFQVLAIAREGLPPAPKILRDLQLSCFYRGRVLKELSRLEEAEVVLRNGVDIVDEMLVRFPDYPDEAHALGACFDMLAQVLLLADRPAEAREAARRAATQSRDVPTQVVGARWHDVQHLATLAEAQAFLGEQHEFEHTVNDMLETAVRGKDLLDAARRLDRCQEHWQQQDTADAGRNAILVALTEARLRLAEHGAELPVKGLTEHLESPDLDTLRQLPRFQALVDRAAER